MRRPTPRYMWTPTHASGLFLQNGQTNGVERNRPDGRDLCPPCREYCPAVAHCRFAPGVTPGSASREGKFDVERQAHGWQ